MNQQSSCYLAPLLFVLGVSCSGSSPPAAQSPTSKQPAPQVEVASEPLELNADEAIILKGLKRHVQQMAGVIGERNQRKSWELAECSDYLATELEALGYPIERQGYETGSVAAQNLSITVVGGGRGKEHFFVGAHYDSSHGSAGFDSALTSAALLELARMMHGAKIERTLRLVFFAMGESPSADGEARGARVFARKIAKEARRQPPLGIDHPAPVSEIDNFGVLTLESLVEVIRDPKRAEIALLPLSSSQSGWKIEAALAASFAGDPFRFSSAGLADGESDARAFAEVEIPSLEFGTNVGGGEEARSLEAISEQQFEDAAQIVMRIRQGLGDILIERGTNDAMVTPL